MLQSKASRHQGKPAYPGATDIEKYELELKENEDEKEGA
jgi:hypothetical protein